MHIFKIYLMCFQWRHCLYQSSETIV